LGGRNGRDATAGALGVSWRFVFAPVALRAARPSAPSSWTTTARSQASHSGAARVGDTHARAHACRHTRLRVHARVRSGVSSSPCIAFTGRAAPATQAYSTDAHALLSGLTPFFSAYPVYPISLFLYILPTGGAASAASLTLAPDPPLLAVLRALAADPHNRVFLFSSSPRSDLQTWFASVVRPWVSMRLDLHTSSKMVANDCNGPVQTWFASAAHPRCR
jgi:hypothetical protein